MVGIGFEKSKAKASSSNSSSSGRLGGEVDQAGQLPSVAHDPALDGSASSNKAVYCLWRAAPRPRHRMPMYLNAFYDEYARAAAGAFRMQQAMCVYSAGLARTVEQALNGVRSDGQAFFMGAEQFLRHASVTALNNCIDHRFFFVGQGVVFDALSLALALLIAQPWIFGCYTITL